MYSFWGICGMRKKFFRTVQRAFWGGSYTLTFRLFVAPVGEAKATASGTADTCLPTMQNRRMTMKKFLLTLPLLALPLLVSTEAQAVQHFVYCDDGQILVDQRNLADLQKVRSRAYQIAGPFQFRLDADAFIQKHHPNKKCVKR